jgi:hypothetical protein
MGQEASCCKEADEHVIKQDQIQGLSAKIEQLQEELKDATSPTHESNPSGDARTDMTPVYRLPHLYLPKDTELDDLWNDFGTMPEATRGYADQFGAEAWRDFHDAMKQDNVELRWGCYFECFPYHCPSRELWFQVRSNDEKFKEKFVVLHIHYTLKNIAAGVEPDFSRVIHVNIRFAVPHGHGQPSPNSPPRVMMSTLLTMHNKMQQSDAWKSEANGAEDWNIQAGGMNLTGGYAHCMCANGVDELRGSLGEGWRQGYRAQCRDHFQIEAAHLERRLEEEIRGVILKLLDVDASTADYRRIHTPKFITLEPVVNAPGGITLMDVWIDWSGISGRADFLEQVVNQGDQLGSDLGGGNVFFLPSTYTGRGRPIVLGFSIRVRIVGNVAAHPHPNRGERGRLLNPTLPIQADRHYAVEVDNRPAPIEISGQNIRGECICSAIEF